MKKIFYYACLVMFAFATTSVLMACGDDDDDTQGNQNELLGWYICNDELITEKNMGMSNDGSRDSKGELIWKYDDAPRIIHIVDATHLDYYQKSPLYEPGEAGTEGKDKVYQIKLDGKTMAFYGIPKRITYNKRTDGGIDFPLEGSQIIFAKTDKGFEVTAGYWQGSGDSYKILLKYDPNRVY